MRSQRARWNGGFGGWTTLSAWQSTTKTSAAIAPGYTYCYEVQARDAAGNVGAWSANSVP